MDPNRRPLAILFLILAGLVVILLVWPAWLLQPASATQYKETFPLTPKCTDSSSLAAFLGAFDFHFVLFRFWSYYGCGIPGVVNGTGTESSGMTYGFLFSSVGVEPWETVSWTAPDNQFGVRWNWTGFVTLMVES